MKSHRLTVYPKKYAHCFCFAVLFCGYTLTDFPISIRLTSLALWQSNDCHSASKATLMNMDKYFMWIHYERFHNHNKAKHNKTVCIFLGIYCTYSKNMTGSFKQTATLNTSNPLLIWVPLKWGYICNYYKTLYNLSLPTDFKRSRFSHTYGNTNPMTVAAVCIQMLVGQWTF